MLFFDTETTGLIRNVALSLDKQPHIIEIGIVRDPDIKGRNRHFHTTLHVPVKLEPIITKITGLKDDDLVDSPIFAEIYDELCEFAEGETKWVAHNVPFDRGMLDFELQRINVAETLHWPVTFIDTVQLAKPHYNGRFMKLIKLYEDLIGPYKQTHRAIDDAEMLLKVYHALMVKG